MNSLKVVFICLLGGVTLAFGQSEVDRSLAEVFSSPEMQKRIMASYGVRSDVEPPALERDAGRFFNENVVAPVQAGDTQAAITALEGYITPESNANFDFTLATLYLQEGKQQDAIKFYRSAIKKLPDFLRAHKNLGIVLAQMGDFEAAKESIQKTIALGGMDADSFGLLAYCNFSLGDYLAALEGYRMASLIDSSNREWLVGLSRALMETGQDLQAEVALKQLIGRNPTDVRYWQTLANVYMNTQRYPQAISAIEVARRMGKGNLSLMRTLGDLYMSEGLADIAFNVYEETIGMGLRKSDAFQLAELFTQRDEGSLTRKWLNVIRNNYADSLSNEDKVDLLNLEAIVSLNEGETAEGARILRDILKVDTLNYRAMLQLGIYHSEREEFGEAEYYFETAARSSDDDIAYDALVKHAVMKVSQSEYSAAAELIQNAIRIRDEERLQSYLEAVRRAAERTGN
jgi:tetratricopeptide (TPR) repeat protein